MKYSIVVPAYNEADKISSTVVQILNFMRNFTDSFELLISDDGSTDSTVSILEQFDRRKSRT